MYINGILALCHIVELYDVYTLSKINCKKINEYSMRKSIIYYKYFYIYNKIVLYKQYYYNMSWCWYI